MTQLTMTDTQTETQSDKKSMSLQRIMLSVEGIAVLISSIAIYWYIGGNWWLFALLLLSPDLAIIIYALDKKLGIYSYNIVHTYTLPLILGIISLMAGWQLGITLAIIWFAHIGMDRSIGYGLKYYPNFKDTHLQRV